MQICFNTHQKRMKVGKWVFKFIFLYDTAMQVWSGMNFEPNFSSEWEHLPPCTAKFWRAKASGIFISRLKECRILFFSSIQSKIKSDILSIICILRFILRKWKCLEKEKRQLSAVAFPPLPISSSHSFVTVTIITLIIIISSLSSTTDIS